MLIQAREHHTQEVDASLRFLQDQFHKAAAALHEGRTGAHREVDSRQRYVAAEVSQAQGEYAST
eukprot:12736897-Heterocapsa_arctica.AAC.1